MLDYDEVMRAAWTYIVPWLAGTYVKAMNIIHYMHDKYAYEKIQMALHDTDVHSALWPSAWRGCAVMADSLSAIRYAKVQAHPRRTAA